MKDFFQKQWFNPLILPCAALYIVQTHFDQEQVSSRVEDVIELQLSALQQLRERDVIGASFWQQNMRYTEYFSRWIELKETCLSQ